MQRDGAVRVALALLIERCVLSLTVLVVHCIATDVLGGEEDERRDERRETLTLP